MKSGLVFITLPSFTNTRYCSDSKNERTVMRELDEVEWRSELVLSPDNLHDKVILDDSSSSCHTERPKRV